MTESSVDLMQEWAYSTYWNIYRQEYLFK